MNKKLIAVVSPGYLAGDTDAPEALEEFLNKAMGSIIELYPINKIHVDSLSGQIFIKERAWCITEECCELKSVYDEGNNNPHLLDECSDVLGFLLQLIACLDMEVEIRLTYTYNVNTHFSTAITDLGMLCNLLKNRPWKKSNYLVDKSQFRSQLSKAVSSIWSYISFASSRGRYFKNYSDLIAYIDNGFYNKIHINTNRLKSNY